MPTKRFLDSCNTLVALTLRVRMRSSFGLFIYLLPPSMARNRFSSSARSIFAAPRKSRWMDLLTHDGLPLRQQSQDQEPCMHLLLHRRLHYTSDRTAIRAVQLDRPGVLASK